MGLGDRQVLFNESQRFTERAVNASKFLISEQFLATFVKAMLNAGIKKILKA